VAKVVLKIIALTDTITLINKFTGLNTNAVLEKIKMMNTVAVLVHYR
jgi:hypothetical protein